MRIEKDLKQNNHLNKGENKTNLILMKNFLQNHRLHSRQNFLLKPINFVTVLTFLPFALGFLDFIYKKHVYEKSDPFFQKNLPAFSSLTPKLTVETFEYIYKSNFLNNSHKTISVDSSLSKQMYDKKFLFGRPPFLAKIPSDKNMCFSTSAQKTFSLEKFTGLLCTFETEKTGILFFNNDSLDLFYQNLDELPAYLKGISLKEKNALTNKKLAELFEDFSKTSTKNLFNQSTLLKNRAQKEKFSVYTHRFFLLTSSNISSDLNLIKKSKQKLTPFSIAVFDKSSFKNAFYKNRFSFYKNFSLLNSELQNLVIEKNIFLLPTSTNESLKVSEPSVLKSILTKVSDIDEVFVLDKLLQDFNKKNLSQELSSFRLMSGYNYPDMNLSNLNWFFLQNSFFNRQCSTNLGFKKSNFLSFTKNYNLRIPNLPAVLIETKRILLKNFEPSRVLYNGPTLILDSNKALDWKNQIDTKHSIPSHQKTHKVFPFFDQSLRSWFHLYLSPYNSLIRFQENFFGLYDSPEFNGNEKLSDFSDFSKKSLLNPIYFPSYNRWDLVRSPLKSKFTPFTCSLHIPSEVNFQTDNLSFIRGVNFKISQDDEVRNVEQFLPVVQLQQPRFNFSNSKILKSSSSVFETGLLGKLDYGFPTFSLNEKIFVTNYVSGRYKKIASIFSKRNQLSPVLMDNWEALTSNSWLVVSQLSFAFFIFQVLKALADNYGRELLGYLLDLVSALGVLDDSLKQEIEILMGQREKGFRIILKSRKNFTNIAGIGKLLPEIYELVWFLRNSARDFALSKTLPRGVLLTGPPGTGKTLLVQALAGEAQVPVLVLSGSSLIEPGESGAIKLEMLFQEARQLAPCIVFIDEIDTLAQKRSGVVQNPMGPDELLESLASFQNSTTEIDSISNFHDKQKAETNIQNPLQAEPKQDQLSLLMQFLIELDGIQGRNGVIVIGATNRPEVLDPAVLRPGRFDKILQVGLPGQQKRIEILKLYGQTLGYESEITWDYLGQLTAGFTAADLATLMNESSIKAILNKTAHTIETIEHGIDRVTTSQSEKYGILKRKEKNIVFSNFKFLSFSSKISLLRLAYYQAGKVVVSHLLKTHPNVLVAYLWPRRTTIRSLQITANLQNSIFQFARLIELNERIMGSYAGKAAEFLFLENFSKKSTTDDKNMFLPLSKKDVSSQPLFSNISTLGLDDLLFAQKLIYSLIEKWFLYSKKFKIQKTINLFPNINYREFNQNKEKLEFYNQFIENIETPPMTQALETQTSSLFSTKEKLIPNYNSQMYYFIPWWQQQISSELEFVEKNFSNWSRLYLSNPEQSERNPEWLPPDEFYHSSSGLKNIKTSVKYLTNKRILKTKQVYDEKLQTSAHLPKVHFTWNDVSQITRDYPVHSLVLQSFNQSVFLLDENRELVDRIVIELLYQEILRKPELDKLFEDFDKLTRTNDFSSSSVHRLELSQIQYESKSNQNFQIVETNWGLKSRKTKPRWIDFKNLK